MEGKMMDYTIGIAPDDALHDRIIDTLRHLPKEHQSFNQTAYQLVRFVPLIGHLETKTPATGGQKSDVQICIWGYAGFTKTQQLLEGNVYADEPIPATPMLSAHGHDGHLSALHQQGRQILLLGRLALGGKETVQGIFQIIKALDILASWGNIEYWIWYFEYVLKAA